MRTAAGMQGQTPVVAGVGREVGPASKIVDEAAMGKIRFPVCRGPFPMARCGTSFAPLRQCGLRSKP